MIYIRLQTVSFDNFFTFLKKIHYGIRLSLLSVGERLKLANSPLLTAFGEHRSHAKTQRIKESIQYPLPGALSSVCRRTLKLANSPFNGISHEGFYAAAHDRGTCLQRRTPPHEGMRGTFGNLPRARAFTS